MSIIEDKTSSSNILKAESTMETKSQEDLISPIKPILNRLKSHQPGSLVRFGIEETLNPQEISQIWSVLTRAEQAWNNKPICAELLRLIGQFRGKDKAFDINFGMGGAVVEDSNLKIPQVVTNEAGPVIKVPTETYRLWVARRKLGTAQTILTEYTKRPMTRQARNLAYGTRVDRFVEDLEPSIAEIQK